MAHYIYFRHICGADMNVPIIEDKTDIFKIKRRYFSLQNAWDFKDYEVFDEFFYLHDVLKIFEDKGYIIFLLLGCGEKYESLYYVVGIEREDWEDA